MLDRTVHSVAHGVIRLEELSPNYGPERRRLRISSIFAASTFAGAITISLSRPAACAVFPRLVSCRAQKADFQREQVIPTELPATRIICLAAALNTSRAPLILGPAGTGSPS